LYNLPTSEVSLEAQPLLALAARVAGDHRTESVLDAIVRGLAGQPGVALARIWLLAPGDLCDVCFMRTECPDRTQCLHLVASAGVSVEAKEDWSFLQGYFRRIPLSKRKVGIIAATGQSVLICDSAPQNDWIARPDWAKREGIRGFVGHPLVFRGNTLGVLAIFSREALAEQDSAWLRMFADQAAAGIANAQLFEDVERAGDELRKSEAQLKQVLDVAPVHMFMWEADASASYGNRASQEYFGAIPPKPPMIFLDMITHPEDVGSLKDGIREAISRGEPFEMEARLRRHDGQYRWFLYQLNPLRDEEQRIIRWCGTRIDIQERKQSADRAQRENLALREEIDKVSMFEEIVGTSPALQAVLARVARVAPTDSTVLVTGETGTGKELIARAIHKRSQRATRAFVSVNCAAIPRDLVASELFGHEKGAFTGALQRRLGRFELAEGGTIFLDEIGELPAETQVALLRVLQEREFERVGGGRPIRADVRVIAATHRDLPALIRDGSFRSDLFYRINVFPIEMPPLRGRKEDIRLLVEYFIDRYSTKSGKKIRRIDRKSLDSLLSYPWPGNIRELQNVIERSVIVCDSEDFSVDESWLSHAGFASPPLADELATQEKDLIESALARTKGRVSGPAGAAAVLGMPASTLDSKIKALKIDKRRFHTR
jgi:PAS domain S-box-containing protein